MIHNLNACSQIKQEMLHILKIALKQIIMLANAIYRSSRWEMFHKIGVLKNFAKFTEKHLCQCLFLIKFLGDAT